MPGYFMGVLHSITDESAFREYQRVAMPILEQYGGKPVIASRDIESSDGDWSPESIVLFEFESGEHARRWYNSPEYQAVVGLRIESTVSNGVFMDVE